MTKEQEQYSILIVDDDEGDRFLIHKAMQENGVTNRIQFLEDGQALVDDLIGRLNAARPESPHDLPCLILLDLNMPRLDGHEALKLLKKNSALREIPVVILSNSRNSEDIMNSYKEGANSFFTKPFNFKDLVQLMGVVKTYWFDNAKLPLPN